MGKKEQDQLVAKLSDADLEVRNLKKTIERRIREEMEREVSVAETRRDILAYEAREAGVSVRRISHEGLHTKATVTAYDAIARGKKYRTPNVADDVASDELEQKKLRWADRAKGLLTYTPDESELLPMVQLLDISPSDMENHDELSSAQFTFDRDRGTLAAVTRAFDPSLGRHPVVALVMQESSPVRQDIVDWAAENAA